MKNETSNIFLKIKNSRKMQIGLVLVILLLIVCRGIYVRNYNNKLYKYSQAEGLYEEGDFEEAKKIYETIGSFEDAQKKIDECNRYIDNFPDAAKSVEDRILPIAQR